MPLGDDDDDSSFPSDQLIPNLVVEDEIGHKTWVVRARDPSVHGTSVDPSDAEDTTSTSRKALPNLLECYSWLQPHDDGAGSNHAKKSKRGSNSTISSSSSSSSCSSSSFLSLPMPEPPDGGWGWMVVLGAFFIGFICDGVAYCYGVLYSELLEHFGESKSKTSLVGSIFFGVSMILGPFASSMTTRFGCRKMTILGGLLSSSGFILSYFANSIDMLCFTFSVIVGMGFSFCYVTAVVIVAFYFNKRRSLATGLSVCGTGVGTFFFGPFMEFLISQYSWRGLFLIMAGISLNLVVCGMLFRPLKFTEEERCRLLHEEFEKLTVGRKALEFQRARNSSESSTECSSCSDDESSDEEFRTLSMMSLPTFACGKIGNMSSNLLMEALKNSRNPHLTMQRFMKNALLRLNAEGARKDSEGIDSIANLSNYSINITEVLDSTSQLSISSTHLNQFSSNVDEVVFSSLMNGEGIINQTPKVKRKKQPRSSSAKKTPKSPPVETSEKLLAPTKVQRTNSISSLLPAFNVGRRRAYGIHLPLYRSDIFYRRWMRQNQNDTANLAQGAQLKTCVLGTSCPELVETGRSEPSGGICSRFCKELYEEAYDLASGMLKFSLLSNGFFSVFVASNFLFYFWSDVPYMYAKDHAVNQGTDDQKASFIISVIGILNTLGQVFFGFVGDMDTDLIRVYAIVSFFAGVFIALVPFVSVYWQVCIVYGLFGFCVSVSFPLTTVLMVKYLGLDKLTNAYGLLMFIQGIANIAGPPFAGWVSDITYSYDLSYYLSGFFYALSGLVMLIVYIPACKPEEVVDEDDDEESQKQNSAVKAQEGEKLTNAQL